MSVGIKHDVACSDPRHCWRLDAPSKHLASGVDVSHGCPVLIPCLVSCGLKIRLDSSRGAKDVENDAPVVDREIPREVPAGLEPVTTVAGRA
jgi:hypothetical protein